MVVVPLEDHTEWRIETQAKSRLARPVEHLYITHPGPRIPLDYRKLTPFSITSLVMLSVATYPKVSRIVLCHASCYRDHCFFCRFFYFSAAPLTFLSACHVRRKQAPTTEMAFFWSCLVKPPQALPSSLTIWNDLVSYPEHRQQLVEPRLLPQLPPLP